MRIYFAGVDRPSFLKALWEHGARNILISYFDYKKSFATFAKHLDNYSFNILLDSGAYSAFTRGVKIYVEEYAEFLIQWHSYFERYFNLDVIGDFAGTWGNQDYLESKGLRPVPVFHYGEPNELVRLLVRQYDFIGLGGMVPITEKKLDVWLKDLLLKKNGDWVYPNVKFHGLGLTKRKMLYNYPFYSVDSTTWLVGKKFKLMLSDTGKQIPLTGGDAFSVNIKYFLQLENDIEDVYEMLY